MALPAFKCKIFDDPVALQDFVIASVTTIHAIVTDNSGKYVLFYE